MVSGGKVSRPAAAAQLIGGGQLGASGLSTSFCPALDRRTCKNSSIMNWEL